MIEVSNISFNYAGQNDLVFDDFSLTLKQDNIYGLLGKNGTGKSTLLYLISGLRSADCFVLRRALFALMVLRPGCAVLRH